MVSHGDATTCSVTVGGDAGQVKADLRDDGAAVDVGLDAVALPDDLAESGRACP